MPERKRVAASAAQKAAQPALVPDGCAWPIVLGIDPGTRVLGYGAIVIAPDGPRLLTAGTIRPKASGNAPARLAEIARELPELLRRCRPTHVVVERAFAAINVQSALRIGESRGVALACAAQAGAEVLELSPAAARRSVVGSGAASKEQVAAMVARHLRLPGLELPLDATDALALALAHIQSLRRAMLLGARSARAPLASSARACSNPAAARAVPR